MDRLVLLVIGLAAWLIVIAALRVRVTVAYRQRDSTSSWDIMLSVPGIFGPGQQRPDNFCLPLFGRSGQILFSRPAILEYLSLMFPGVECPPEEQSATDRKTRPAAKKRHRFSLKKAPDVLNRILQANRRYFDGVFYHKLNVSADLGFNDPATTGTSVGLAWALASHSLAGLSHSGNWLSQEPPGLLIRPLFTSPGCRLEFYCIFSLRAGHIINTGVHLMKLLYKA